MHFSPEEAETYSLEPGDILLNEGQSPELVGRCAMFRGELPGLCFQKTLLRFRAGPNVLPEFALLVFRNFLHAGVFRRVAKGSTNIAHLSRVRFAAMEFPVPPFRDQEAIVTEANRRLEFSSAQRASVTSSMAGLQTMREELLSAAATGQLLSQSPQDDGVDAIELTLPLDLSTSPPVSRDVAEHERAITSGISVARDVQHIDSMLVTSSPSSNEVESLADLLRSTGRPMKFRDLFTAAGYDRNSVESVERFYALLRQEFGFSIRHVGGEAENAVFEASF